MARIRSVKPELRTDLTVSEWPREVRYAWVLLLGYLDDYGRGRDDSRLVVADLFPLDRDVTERKINAWLDRMAKSGPLCRYSVDGEHFMHAVKWSNHQRISHPTDSRLPPCPIHDLHDPIPNDTGDDPEPEPNHSGDAPETLRASRAPAEQVSREQGARSKGAGSAPRGARLPEDWKPNDATREWTLGQLSAQDAQTELTKFRNHWLAKTGKDATKLDWDRTWRNWVLNAPNFRRGSPPPNGSTADQRVAQGLALAEQLRAEESQGKAITA